METTKHDVRIHSERLADGWNIDFDDRLPLPLIGLVRELVVIAVVDCVEDFKVCRQWFHSANTNPGEGTRKEPQ